MTARSKRGIFNSIGLGLKTLFRTMDNDDSEYYNEKISTLDSKQHHVYQLEKDQLTVVRNTLTAINHTMRDFKTNQVITVETDRMLEIIETVYSYIDREVTRFYVDVDAIRQGALSIMLITENLSTYLNNVNIQLKTGSTLPLVVTPNTIHGYYDIFETLSWLIDVHVIRIFLRVPLKQIYRIGVLCTFC